MKTKKLILFLFCACILVSSFIQVVKKKPLSYSKIYLGKKLFSEKILSLDSSVSCASCHNPKLAFADTLAYSIGIYGRQTKRNAPSVLNMKNRPYYFYDGRASSLNEQALMPIANEDEMGLPIADAVTRLNQNSTYRKLFLQTFKQLPSAKNLGEAFAAYEETLETVNSKFDDWSNNKATLTKAEESGRVLFTGNKAKCFDCHSMEDFTDDDFKNIGLFNGNYLTDSGRYLITKNTSDLGKFKTTGLRNVAVTAPYMHNGMFATLEEVLKYYNNPKGFFPHQINIDSTFKNELALTAKEQADIISFLKTLTDKAYIKK
jgi:cytochrome c peroxidase